MVLYSWSTCASLISKLLSLLGRIFSSNLADESQCMCVCVLACACVCLHVYYVSFMLALIIITFLHV